MEYMNAPTRYVKLPFSENEFVRKCGVVPRELASAHGHIPWTVDKIIDTWNRHNSDNMAVYSHQLEQYVLHKTVYFELELRKKGSKENSQFICARGTRLPTLEEARDFFQLDVAIGGPLVAVHPIGIAEAVDFYDFSDVNEWPIFGKTSPGEVHDIAYPAEKQPPFLTEEEYRILYKIKICLLSGFITQEIVEQLICFFNWLHDTAEQVGLFRYPEHFEETDTWDDAYYNHRENPFLYDEKPGPDEVYATLVPEFLQKAAERVAEKDECNAAGAPSEKPANLTSEAFVDAVIQEIYGHTLKSEAVHEENPQPKRSSDG